MFTFGKGFGIICDGSKLFLFRGDDEPIIINDVFLESCNINTNTSIVCLGRESMAGQSQGIEVDLSLRGKSATIGGDMPLDYKFAMDMSVRDLLKLINRKVKCR